MKKKIVRVPEEGFQGHQNSQKAQKESQEQKRSFGSDLLYKIGHLVYEGLSALNENNQVSKIVIVSKF